MTTKKENQKYIYIYIYPYIYIFNHHQQATKNNIISSSSSIYIDSHVQFAEKTKMCVRRGDVRNTRSYNFF